MKHLDPTLLADLADGEAPAPAAAAHLRDCAQCRAELAELRALIEGLAAAPMPPAGLQARTLQRLGLRTQRGPWLRWAWAPTLAAAALFWALRPAPVTAPTLAPAPAAPLIAAKPKPKAQPQAPAPAPAPVEAAQAPSQLEAPVVGAVPDPSVLPDSQVHQAPKATPTPIPTFSVQVRNNLIKPGQQLTLIIELPGSESFSAKVFDSRGRAIETLYEGVAGPGPLTLHWDAAQAPSAAYTVLLRSGAQSKKIQVLVAH